MKKIIRWIVDRFSYVQIFVFISLLFLFSTFPITFFWTKTHLQHLRSIDEQLVDLEEEVFLQKVFQLVSQHRLLSQPFFSKDEEKQIELRQVESQIAQIFQEFINSSSSKEDKIELISSPYISKEFLLWRKIHFSDLEEKWKAVLAHSSPTLSKKREILQSAILYDIISWMTYLADKLNVNDPKLVIEYTILNSLVLRLPSFQLNVADLVLFSEVMLAEPYEPSPISIDRLHGYIDWVVSDVSYMKRAIDLKVAKLNAKQIEIIEALDSYRRAAENLLHTVENDVLAPGKSKINRAVFDLQARECLELGYRLWKLGLQDLELLYHLDREYTLYYLWLIIIITVSLNGFAFFIGVALTYSGIVRLNKLTTITQQFAAGNFSVRVSDPNRDAIGHQGEAFNRMAEKLEETILHLYELLNATSSLASGNLSARMKVRHRDPQLDEVALSFNQMGERFAAIIGRLQEIGGILTSSAAKIASASKAQSAIVAGQETTTKEIAKAAYGISSSARNFAHTMNQLNQTAEQTSGLALRGKESLQSMEFIMRHMVEASSDISAKLAVLNEKASNITSVITTITNVAEQTNLLSLNASIEAEKAGEYGRSFAVIAREIRRLADQTALATLDSKKMIGEITSALSSSVTGVADFTNAIRNGSEQVHIVSDQLVAIIGQVQAFTTRLESVNQGMQTQSNDAEQISRTIAELTQTATHITSAIEQFHTTVEELTGAANGLSILKPFTKEGV